MLGPVSTNRWYRVHQLPDDSACVFTMKKFPKSAKKRAKASRIDVNLTQALELKREKVNWLHQQLGHASKKLMRLILAEKPMYGLTAKDVDLLSKCNDCMQGKQRRASRSSIETKEKGNSVRYTSLFR